MTTAREGKTVSEPACEALEARIKASRPLRPAQCRQEWSRSDSDDQFPEHEYPSDFELWLEPDGVVRIRSGVRVHRARDTGSAGSGQALIELADRADRD